MQRSKAYCTKDCVFLSCYPTVGNFTTIAHHFLQSQKLLLKMVRYLMN